VRGALPLPAPGRIVARFGDVDALGQRGEGLEIAAPEWARPRSPFLAFVRYAGPIGGRRLGVALEPAPGELLILAGLAALFVEPGDVLRAGQPVGQLAVIDAVGEEFLVEAPAQGGALSRAMLYVEVREGGSPVPPANWFALPQGRAGTP
ncbi:MAG: peptidase M23, partial [Pseudomonadota bacterium]|nr:peptidase M23 [Pseudomonadota bacterium]